MRKGRCIILIGSLFPLCIHGQILNTPYNLPRSGDRLMKCQIATIPPSKSGIQQIWNFANIIEILVILFFVWDLKIQRPL